MSAAILAGSPIAADELSAAAAALASAPAEKVLAWVESRFGGHAALASSFGPEDIVLLDLAREHAPSLRIFTLDTGRLPAETYELMDAVRRRFGVAVETYFPERDKVEALQSEHGYFSFRESVEARKHCCAIRKVEPLRRALRGRLAWVTGVRRGQSATRTDVPVLQLDPEHGIAKVSPLAHWSGEAVWAHIRERGLPYNALHDQGYASIGCAPCTRAVKPYEDERAGRWWWESSDHKECGLHVRRGGR